MSDFVPSPAVFSTFRVVIFCIDEQNQSLVARAFDARTLKVDGTALPVHQGVATLGSTLAQFAVSDTGTLVYIPHANLPAETLTWVNRDGSEKALPFPPGRLYQSPRISPDGSRLIVVGDRGFGAPILLANLTMGTFGELPRQKGSFGPAPIPAWTPDGMSVTYNGANQRDQIDSAGGPQWRRTCTVHAARSGWRSIVDAYGRGGCRRESLQIRVTCGCGRRRKESHAG